MLKSEKTQKEYQEVLDQESFANELTWTQLATSMKKAAKEVCGLEDKRSKTSQWTICHEKEASEFKLNIQELTRRRREANDTKDSRLLECYRKYEGSTNGN